MSNMSELDARIFEAIEKVAKGSVAKGDITTFWEDESRTAHADGSVTYARHITEEWYPDAPSWANFVGATYRDGVRLGDTTFAEFRSDLIEWGRWA